MTFLSLILDTVQIVGGLLLALFLPGYLCARIFWRDLAELEKIGLGMVLSISLDIVIGIVLGYNKYMKELTGGITTQNLWLILGTITLALLYVYSVRNRDEVEKIIAFLSGKRS